MNTGVSFGGLVFPFVFFLVTGTLLISIIPAVNQRVRSVLDRLLLGLFAGMAFYMLTATVLNALLKVRLTTLSIAVLFLVTTAAMGYVLWKRKLNPLGEVSWGQLVVFALLMLVFGLAMHNRMESTLKYPTRLLDTDPYRHHDRTRALIATGDLSAWDSNIYGKVPILEMQGCYVLPAVISLLSGVPAWCLWKYGAPVMGAISILGTYLLGKYSFRGNSAAGILAAAFLAASPIHILRTSMGFSEAYALPFLPVTLLLFLFLIKDLRYGHSLFFGLFYTAMAMANPNPAYFLLPILILYSLVMFFKCKQRLRLVTAIFLSSVVFFAFFALWMTVFSAISPVTHLEATGSVGTNSLGRTEVLPNTLDLIQNNLGRKTISVHTEGIKGFAERLLTVISEWIVPALAVLGIGALLADRRKETGKGAVKFPNARLFHIIFFVLSLLVAIFIARPFSLPLVGRIRLPSFTMKLYRYYLLPGWSVSMLAGWALIAVCDGAAWWKTRSKPAPAKRLKFSRYLYAIVIAMVLGLYTARPCVWGHWGMNCTEEEYAAADWIKHYTSQDALIVTSWYSADFLRSLTGRRMVVIGKLRPELEIIDKVIPIERPPLSAKEPLGIIEFAARHKERVYLISGKHGPVEDFSRYPGFTKVFDTDLSLNEFDESNRSWGATDTRLRIYRVEKDGETKKVKVDGNLAFVARPIGGCEAGTIRNLSKLNDGSLGRNRDTDAVYSAPEWQRSRTAWLGLDFTEKRKVVALRVTFGMYAVPVLMGRNPQEHVPLDLQFQYWYAGGWVDIPGSRLTQGAYQTVRLYVGAINTEKVRVVVTRVRNGQGQTKGGGFRIAALEFAAYTHKDANY